MFNHGIGQIQNLFVRTVNKIETVSGLNVCQNAAHALTSISIYFAVC